MRNEGLLSIGSFSLLAGLSVPALRHYDDVGVIKPAFVDPATGYRYYDPNQVRTARLIRALRAVDLPVDELKDVLETQDEEYVRSVLSDHRERLAERSTVLSAQLEALDEYIEKGVAVPLVRGNRIAMVNVAVHDVEREKKFYEDVFGVEFQGETHEGQVAKHYQGNFGTWPEDNFFLMQLFEDPERAGTVNIGFLCEDLEGTYKKALAAGGIDCHAPKDLPGMPRVAQVMDPSGNDLGLYQG